MADHLKGVKKHAEEHGVTLAELCALVVPPVADSTRWRWETGRSTTQGRTRGGLLAYDKESWQRGIAS